MFHVTHACVLFFYGTKCLVPKAPISSLLINLQTEMIEFFCEVLRGVVTTRFRNPPEGKTKIMGEGGKHCNQLEFENREWERHICDAGRGLRV